MQGKSTEELLSIWTENNQKAWSTDELTAVQNILLERLGKLPAQKTENEAKVLSTKKENTDKQETLGEPFFNLSPYNNFRAGLALFCIICLCIGLVMGTMVEQNTKLFLNFARTSQVSDIEKLEIQSIDPTGHGIGKTIAINDEKSVREFVSALKTIEEYRPVRDLPENLFRVKIWRTKNRTIEFECYTVKGEGHTIFVRYLWIKPGGYGFGNGNAKFSSPDLYNWWKKNGMEIQ